MADLETKLKELSTNIKSGAFENIYFFYGAEEYLKKRYTEDIINGILDENSRDMNLDIITKEEYDVKVLEDKINTLPFFSEKKVIVIKDIGIGDKKELLPILETAPSYVCLIVIETNIKKTTSLYKFLAKKSYIVEIDVVTEGLATKWIAKTFKESGKGIDKEDIKYMIRRIGLNMNLLLEEINKLISYVGERGEVLKEDIDAISTQNIESKIFDLIKKICDKDASSAIGMFKNLLLQKEPPVMMLYMISRQFMLIYEAKLLNEKGYNWQDIGKRLNIYQTFIVRELLMQAANYSESELKSILRECLEVDINIKSGITEPEKSLELLIYKLIKKDGTYASAI